MYQHNWTRGQRRCGLQPDPLTQSHDGHAWLLTC
jgi:hypothetical protein